MREERKWREKVKGKIEKRKGEKERKEILRKSGKRERGRRERKIKGREKEEERVRRKTSQNCPTHSLRMHKLYTQL